MNIKDAIDHLTELEGVVFDHHRVAMIEALELGIEALKRYQDFRSNPEFIHWELLPGETEE